MRRTMFLYFHLNADGIKSFTLLQLQLPQNVRIILDASQLY